MDVFGIYALKEPINLIEILKRDIEGLGHQKTLALLVPVVTDLLHAVFLRLGFVVDLFLEVFADFDGVVDLVGMFDATVSAVNSAIKAIIKSDALHDYDVCKCIRLDSGNSADVYNMEVVIALAFRLKTDAG